MRIIKNILFICFIATSVSVYAVKPNNTEVRNVYLNVLRLLEEYEAYSSVRNDVAQENFKSMFKSDSIMLFNDLIGLSSANALPVDEYINLLKDVNGVKSQIKNIKSGSIKDAGDRWIIDVSFDKLMQYNTECGAIIDSEDYYDGQSYKISATVSVNKNTGISYIESLNGFVDSDHPALLPDFALVEKNDDRDIYVRNNGRKLKFNKYGQALVSKPYQFNYPDADVKLKVIESGDEKCRNISFAYKPTRLRIRPNVGISMGSPYKISDNNMIDASSSGMEFGVDFGYVFPSHRKLKCGLFLGFGVTTGKIDLSSSDLNYHYQAAPDADMDGDSYIRFYELSDVRQSVKLGFLNIPIYADFEYNLSRRVSLHSQVGIKSYINSGSKIDSYSASAYSYGVYPQYQNLVISESWLNEFGQRDLTLENLGNPLAVNSFSMDLLLGIGAQVRLVGSLSLNVALQYQQPLNDRIQSNNALSLSSGEMSLSSAPVTYTVAGGQVVSHSLCDYCKIKTNPLKINIGLSFSF